MNAVLARLLAPATFIALWSGAFIAVRAGLPDVSPLTFLATRFMAASAILLLASLAWRRWRLGWVRVVPMWRDLAISGVLINGAYLSAGYLAMTHIKGAMMALVGALAPVVTAFIATRLLGEAIRPLQWFGFALGFAGVVMVVGLEPEGFALGPGLGWAFASMLCIVAGTLYYNRRCQGAPLVPANCLQLGAGALFCWLLVALFESPRVEVTPAALWSFAYLTLGVSLGGMGIYLYMLGRGTAGRVIANLYLTPGVTAMLGWLILGEAFSVKALAGFAVSMLGLWFVQRRQPA